MYTTSTDSQPINLNNFSPNSWAKRRTLYLDYPQQKNHSDQGNGNKLRDFNELFKLDSNNLFQIFIAHAKQINLIFASKVTHTSRIHSTLTTLTE